MTPTQTVTLAVILTAIPTLTPTLTPTPAPDPTLVTDCEPARAQVEIKRDDKGEELSLSLACDGVVLVTSAA